MKTLGQTCLRAIFVALFLLNACTAPAATVSWTGAGGDGLWHTDANWSGGAVPGPGDDVTINVPGNPVITITGAGANVHRIQCAESLQVLAGSVAIGDGLSSFTGPVNLQGGWLSVDGASALLNVSGATALSAFEVYAYNGAKIWLTNLATIAMTNGNAVFWAHNEGGAIYAPNVTNIISTLPYQLVLHAYEGGLVDLRRLKNPDAAIWVNCRATNSTVDLSGFGGVLAPPLNAGSHSFTADGGTILMPQIRALNRSTINVLGEGQVIFGSVTNIDESSFFTYAGGQLWLSNVTSIALTNSGMAFRAQDAGSAIYVPNVTNLFANAAYSFTLDLSAFDGGLVDLRKLRNPEGVLWVYVSGTDSVVDLSGLHGVLAAPPARSHSFNATDGVIRMPQVTALTRANVSVTGEGQVGFGVLTNILESSLYAYNGAKLWLTNLTSLPLTNGYTTVWAQGADAAIYLSNVTNIFSSGYALSVYAHDGGLLDLHRLRNPDSSLYVHCRAAGSVVDLSGLSGVLVAPEGTSHIFSAEGGVILMPQVHAFTRVYVNVTGDGQVSFGTLTNVLETSFGAYNGGRLWLTNLTTLVLTNRSMSLTAQGADAAIYLPNVTNIVSNPAGSLYVYADGGGFVDLRRLRNPDCALYVDCRNAGSVVDLSGFSGTVVGPPNAVHTFHAWGGVILMPNVTAFERVDLGISNEGSLITSPLQSLRYSSLSVDHATNDFSQLLTLADSSVNAYNGAKIWLTNITTLYVTNLYMTIQASGSEAAVYLPNVTNAVFLDTSYSLSARADAGGEVDLRRLPNPDGPFSVFCRAAGSVVNLSSFHGTFAKSQVAPNFISVEYGGTVLMPNVTALDQVYLNILGEVHLPTANWRSITRSQVIVQSSTNDFGRLTNVLGTSFFAQSGGKIWLTNLTTLFITSGNVWIQTWYDEAAIYLPNVTNIVIDPFSNLHVETYWNSSIDLHNVGDVSGGSFSVVSRLTGSVVDLSGLTALTPRVSGSSLVTQDGGVILLNDTALLISNVALDFESSPNDIIPPFANPGTDMVLYAHAWDAYLIEARDTRNPNSPWKLYLRVPMTNAIQTVAALPPPDLAFRVTVLVADPPALRIDHLEDQQTRLTLFGVPGQSYRLESKPVLVDTEPWQNGTSVTLTNAFRIFPASSSADLSRFYRARKL